MNYFSTNIKHLRKKRGIRQADMPNLIGIARTTWSSYEIGASEPNIDNILRISHFFRISTTDLLEVDLTTTDAEFTSEVPLHVSLPSAENMSGVAELDAFITEILKAKQQTIETQSQVILSLQALIDRLVADMAKAKLKSA